MENIKTNLLMKKRCIFVGIHNKPGKTPLDSSTRSGKVIDAIISGLTEFDCLKTNLHNLEYLPEDSKVHWDDTFTEWRKRAGLKPGQVVGRDVVVVCLGSYTQQMFRRTVGMRNILKIGHPAVPRSTESMNKYITTAIAKINHPVNL